MPIERKQEPPSIKLEDKRIGVPGLCFFCWCVIIIHRIAGWVFKIQVLAVCNIEWICRYFENKKMEKEDEQIKIKF